MSAVIRCRIVATSARVALPLGSKIVGLFPEMRPFLTAHFMASDAHGDTWLPSWKRLRLPDAAAATCRPIRGWLPMR